MENKGEIIIFKTEDNQIQIDVRLDEDTVWLNQYQMAELFQTDRTSILRHLKNIYKIKELNETSTCAKITQVQMSILFQRDRTVITRHVNNIFKDGELKEKSNVQKMHFPFSDKQTKLCTLDLIISVGYRVKSQRGTQFRIWANNVAFNTIILMLFK